MQRVLIIAALATPIYSGCSGAEETAEAVEQATEEIQAAVESSPSTVLGRIGGTLVASDQFYVEVLPHRDGLVQALVLNAEGEVVPDAGDLQVTVAGADGSPKVVTLEWDPIERRYIGQVEDDLAASGAVNVSVTAGGSTHTGTVAKLVTAPEVAAHGGTIVVAGEYSAEVLGKPDGSVIAYLQGPDGAIQDTNDLDLNVSLQADDGESHQVSLAWNPEIQAYVSAPQPEVTWVVGPMALEVGPASNRARARVESVFVVPPPPAHSGEVVVVGDMSVELVPDDDVLKAYVVGTDGAVTDPQAHVVVMVDQQPVTLAWDADAGYYKAPVDPRLDVTATPVHVVVTHRGRRRWGGFRTVHAPAFQPWHERRVTVRANLPEAETTVVAAPPSVGLRWRGSRARLRARGIQPGASIRVRHRGPDVRVNTPGAMVSVRTPGASVRVTGMGTQVRVPGAAGVRVGAMGGVQVRTPGAGVRVRAPGAGVQVRTRAPMGMAAVRVRTPRAPMGMASASVRVRGPGGSVSVMARAGMR